MTVKAALQEEYFNSFLSSEKAFHEKTAAAHINTGADGFEWYIRGPAQEHLFNRSELDRQISLISAAELRMAKNAADHITTTERTFNSRYHSRIQVYARANVRQQQCILAGEMNRELLEEVIS